MSNIVHGIRGFVSFFRSKGLLRLVSAGLFASACQSGKSKDAVHLQSELRSGEPILTVVPAPGYRINARVPPALELAAGRMIRINRGRLSADSAFFVERPWVPEPRRAALKGTLRAGICRLDESLCRIAVVSVDLRTESNP